MAQIEVPQAYQTFKTELQKLVKRWHYTKEEIDNKISNTLSNYYTKTEINNKTSNYYTKAETTNQIAENSVPKAEGVKSMTFAIDSGSDDLVLSYKDGNNTIQRAEGKLNQILTRWFLPKNSMTSWEASSSNQSSAYISGTTHVYINRIENIAIMDYYLTTQNLKTSNSNVIIDIPTEYQAAINAEELIINTSGVPYLLTVDNSGHIKLKGYSANSTGGTFTGQIVYRCRGES